LTHADRHTLITLLVLPRFGGHGGVSSDGGDVLVGGGAVVVETAL
jgi:hypothetical protein